jgi:hypothetical protein
MQQPKCNCFGIKMELQVLQVLQALQGPQARGVRLVPMELQGRRAQQEMVMGHSVTKLATPAHEAELFSLLIVTTSTRTSHI